MKKALWVLGMIVGVVIAGYGLQQWSSLDFTIPLKTKPEASQTGDVFLILLGGGIFANALIKYKSL